MRRRDGFTSSFLIWAVHVLTGLLGALSAAQVDINLPSNEETVDAGAELAPGVIPKTAFSSRLRLIFLVGLEGTGHHYFVGALRDLFASNANLPYFNMCPVAKQLYLYNSMGQDPAHYASVKEYVDGEMQKLAEWQFDADEPGSIASLQPIRTEKRYGCQGVGMLSYPVLNGASKPIQYPDLRVLAEAAEANGIDFRVVYMKRSAANLLVANTVHRHFDKSLGDNPSKSTPASRFMHYIEITLTDAAVVHSMLSELDPRFVICHDYDVVPDADQAADVAAFIAPTQDLRNSLVRSLMDTAHPRSHDNSPPERIQYPDSDIVIQRLQTKMDIFEAPICGKRPIVR